MASRIVRISPWNTHTRFRGVSLIRLFYTIPLTFSSNKETLRFHFFFFNDPPPPEIYSLSLHDALPISVDDLTGVVVHEIDEALEHPAAADGLVPRNPEVLRRLVDVDRPDVVLDGSTRTTSGRSTSTDRKSTRLNSSHLVISYAVFCLKK